MTHLREFPEHVQLLDKPGHKNDSSQPLKVSPSPIESYACQSFENDQREKPPSVLCKYEKTSSFIEFDRL